MRYLEWRYADDHHAAHIVVLNVVVLWYNLQYCVAHSDDDMVDGCDNKMGYSRPPAAPLSVSNHIGSLLHFFVFFSFWSMLHLVIPMSVLVNALYEINLYLQVIKRNYISIPSMSMMTEKMKGLYEQMGCGWFPQAPYVSRRWLAIFYSVWATAQRVSVVHTVPYQRVEPFQ